MKDSVGPVAARGVGTLGFYPDERGSLEAGVYESGSLHIRTDDACPVEICPFEVGAGEVHICKVEVTEVSSFQVRLGEFGGFACSFVPELLRMTDEFRAFQVRVGESS